jgi:DNA repair protein RecO (recombination protein O)
MHPIKDQGIVLRRLDFSESSQVLAVFTRQHGKVRVIAKGVKRSTKTRFAPAIDLLECGSIVVSSRASRGAELSTLIEWKQTTPMSGLRSRLDRLYAAQYLAGITADLTEDWDPHPGLFKALFGALEGLQDAVDVLPIVVRFQRALLLSVGSMPRFDACMACSRSMPAPGPIHFSSFEGGLICRDCEAARSEKYEVSRPALAWLAGDADDASGLCHAFGALDYHMAHLIGRKPALSATLLSLYTSDQKR